MNAAVTPVDTSHVDAGLAGLLSRSGLKPLRVAGRWLLVYGAIVAAAGLMYQRLPNSFLPNEDQGYLIVNVQLPPGATTNRTEAAVKQVEDFMLKQPEVQKVYASAGVDPVGSSPEEFGAFIKKEIAT